MLSVWWPDQHWAHCNRYPLVSAPDQDTHHHSYHPTIMNTSSKPGLLIIYTVLEYIQINLLFWCLNLGHKSSKDCEKYRVILWNKVIRQCELTRCVSHTRVWAGSQDIHATYKHSHTWYTPAYTDHSDLFNLLFQEPSIHPADKTNQNNLHCCWHLHCNPAPAENTDDEEETAIKGLICIKNQLDKRDDEAGLSITNNISKFLQIMLTPPHCCWIICNYSDCANNICNKMDQSDNEDNDKSWLNSPTKRRLNRVKA